MDASIPDFGFDPDDDSSLPSTVPPETAGPVGVPATVEWGSLALELMLNPSASASICQTYRTTPEIVLAMLGKATHPLVPTPVAAFKTAIREARIKVESLGPSAGFVLRSQAIAEQSLTRLHAICTGKGIDPSVALKAIGMAAKYGRMDPDAEKRSSDGPAAPAVGVMVQFSFGAGLPVPPALIIDAKPTTEDSK